MWYHGWWFWFFQAVSLLFLAWLMWILAGFLHIPQHGGKSRGATINCGMSPTHDSECRLVSDRQLRWRYWEPGFRCCCGKEHMLYLVRKEKPMNSEFDLSHRMTGEMLRVSERPSCWRVYPGFVPPWVPSCILVALCCPLSDFSSPFVRQSIPFSSLDRS